MDRGKLLIDSSKDWRVIYKHREMRNKILIAMAVLYGLSVVSFVLEVFIWPFYLFPATIAGENISKTSDSKNHIYKGRYFPHM